MMNVVNRFFLLSIVILFLSCSETDNLFGNRQPIYDNPNWPSIMEENTPNLIIKQGFVSQKADTFRVIRNGQVKAFILLSDPIKVIQANDEQKWGYYQFPKLYRTYNGHIICKWQMKEDSHLAYGGEGYARLMSNDEGLTWHQLDQDYFYIESHRCDLENNDVLQIETPKSVEIASCPSFPKPVNVQMLGGANFYLESNLPDTLRGVYLTYWSKSKNEVKRIHGILKDQGLLRYSINGLMPIVWWGDIKEIGSNSYIAGVYPGFYQNSKGDVLKSAVSFYKTTDGGYNWSLQGKIPYLPSGEEKFETQVYDGNDGFTEPAFEILNNGNYLCVMRTSSTTPLYKSYSSDGGIHWTLPEPFTPNGVLPRLLLLENNVLVLASGRPGMQIRINIDGDGQSWTEPIEMMPFLDSEGNYDIWKVGCGYPDLMYAGDNTFYIVYSNFMAKNSKNEERNTIFFRKIEVVVNQ